MDAIPSQSQCLFIQTEFAPTHSMRKNSEVMTLIISDLTKGIGMYISR